MNNEVIEETANLLEEIHIKYPLFIFITGASGSGKSLLASLLEQKLDSQYSHIAYFDKIGVPSDEDMIRRYGSGKKWQEITTYKWVEQLKSLYFGNKKLIVLEGQYDPIFAVDACKKFDISYYKIINIYATRSVRDYRLKELRNQPELANDTMNNWAEVLRRKTLEIGGSVISNDKDIGYALAKVVAIIKTHL